MTEEPSGVPEKNRKTVEIYTDGACSGNPGPGGWAAILLYRGHEKVIAGHDGDTTNNRMELLAAINAMQCLKESCDVSIYSDSAYLVDAFNKNWIERWERNNWIVSKTKGVRVNVDLWRELIRLKNLHNVRFIKVAGHSDNYHNNRCDRLAVSEIEKNKTSV